MDRAVRLGHIYTTGELAEFFECSRDAVLSRRRQGLLEGVKMGGNYFFPGKDVAKFIQQNKGTRHTRGFKNCGN